MRRFINIAVLTLLAFMAPTALAVETLPAPEPPVVQETVAEQVETAQDSQKISQPEDEAPNVLSEPIQIAGFFGPGNYGGFTGTSAQGLIGSAGPASISGLKIWLTPESMANDGTNVTAWDNVGSPYDFTQVVDTAKRFRYAATGGPEGGPAARGNATNNSYMLMDSGGLGLLNAATGGTSFVVWKTTGTQSQDALYIDTSVGLSTNRFTHHHQNDGNGNGSVTFRTPGNASDSYGFENTFASNSGVFTDGVYGIETVRHDVPGNHVTFNYNGRLVGDNAVWYYGAGATYTAANSTRITIGAGGNAGQYDQMRADGYIAELLMYNRPLTYAEEQIVWSYLHAKYPSIAKAYGSEDTLVVYDGDSNMKSLTKPKDSIPVLVTYALTNPSKIYWRNDAQAGWSIQQTESDITAANGILNGVYPPQLSLKNAIYALSVGTNNVSSGSESAATAFGRLTTLLNTLGTNNIAVHPTSGLKQGRIVALQFPRTDNTTTANVFAYNTEMMNRYNELANKGVEGIVYTYSLAPLDGSPDGLTDVSDTTYFNADKIHLNATGTALLAPLYVAQIEQVRKKRQIEALYGQYIKAWYAAGEEITLNSSTISSWGDRNATSTNTDMVQATAAKQPTFSKNHRLGYPGVDFDGVASPNNDVLAVAAAGRDILRNNNNALLIGAIASDGAPASNEYIFLSAINGSNSTARVGLVHSSADKILVAARNQDGGSADSTTSTASLGTSNTVLAAYMDFANTDSYIWLNGTLDTTDLTFDNGVSPKKLADTTAGYVSLGGDGNNGNIFNGKILEFIILADFPDKTTEDACRDLIEEYLGKKFTITVSMDFPELRDNAVPLFPTRRPLKEVA